MGIPLPKGEANPGSRAARQIRAAEFKALEDRCRELEARLEAIKNADPDPDADTSPRTMRKVLGQQPAADTLGAESVLREWLAKDPKGFIAAIEEKEEKLAGFNTAAARIKELEAENAALKGTSASGPDEGSAAALELIERCLSDD